MTRDYSRTTSPSRQLGASRALRSVVAGRDGLRGLAVAAAGHGLFWALKPPSSNFSSLTKPPPDALSAML